jgi:hypothetical protein
MEEKIGEQFEVSEFLSVLDIDFNYKNIFGEHLKSINDLVL